jgi:hypothetical protein
MLNDLLDHGLPLVSLKEQRRELIVGMIGRPGPVPSDQLHQIATLQLAIAAIEAVIGDLDDDEFHCSAAPAQHLSH